MPLSADAVERVRVRKDKNETKNGHLKATTRLYFSTAGGHEIRGGKHNANTYIYIPVLNPSSPERLSE